MRTAARPAVPHLLAAFQHGSDSERVQVSCALAQIDPNVKDTEPFLRVTLASYTKELAIEPAHALLLLRPNDSQALEVLRRGLQDERAEMRYYTICFFTMLGLNALDAAPDLELVLNDPIALIRVISAVALLKMGIQSKAVVEVLKDGLKSHDSEVRQFSINGWKKLGNKAI